MPSYDTPVKATAKQQVVLWKRPMPRQAHRACIENARNNLEGHWAHEWAGPFAMRHSLEWGISVWVQRKVARGMAHFLMPEGSSPTADCPQAWCKVIFLYSKCFQGLFLETFFFPGHNFSEPSWNFCTLCLSHLSELYLLIPNAKSQLISHSDLFINLKLSVDDDARF